MKLALKPDSRSENASAVPAGSSSRISLSGSTNAPSSSVTTPYAIHCSVGSTPKHSRVSEHDHGGGFVELEHDESRGNFKVKLTED